MQFTSKRPHYEHLRTKWTARHRAIQTKVWDKHKEAFRHLALGSLGTLLLLTSPHNPSLLSPTLTASRDDVLKDFDQNVLLAQQFSDATPKDMRSLDSAEEKEIIQILSKNFNFKVAAEIDGIRLNRNYGLIGGEQHLHRYPGDTLYDQMDTTVDWARYGEAGMAPSLGAWGYFAPSKEEFREIDKMREKYYLAIQTFLVSGYAENFTKYRVFFKFRKMLVINPKTGQSVVAVIGDAGPAEWTGKHLGGSPEVMDGLGLATGPRQGPVLYFFIDDPKNEIPLGPVKIKTRA